MEQISNFLEAYVESIDALRQVGHTFWKRGWSLGASGSYSLVLGRSPMRLLVTAVGTDKGNLSRSDFVIVDSSGSPTPEDQPGPSADTLLHCLAAEDAQVGAVLHTRSVWSSVLSARLKSLGGILIEGDQILTGLAGVTTSEHSEWFPIFDNSCDRQELADRVRAAIANSDQPLHGYLIHQHGITTWGRDLPEAVRHIEIMEFLFEVLARQGAVS